MLCKNAQNAISCECGYQSAMNEEQFCRETYYNNFYYHNLLNSTNVSIILHIEGNAVSESPDKTIFQRG